MYITDDLFLKAYLALIVISGALIWIYYWLHIDDDDDDNN